MPAEPSPSRRADARVLLARAWQRRCPRCGQGALFQSFFRLRAECSRCGLVYRREQGAMTGQMYLSAAVTQIVAALLIALIWLGTDWSPAVSMGVSVPLMIAFSYWFLPRAMALWVVVEFMTDVANHDVPAGPPPDAELGPEPED